MGDGEGLKLKKTVTAMPAKSSTITVPKKETEKIPVKTESKLEKLFTASLNTANEKSAEQAARDIENIGVHALFFLVSKLDDKKGGLNAFYLAARIIEAKNYNETYFESVVDGKEVVNKMVEKTGSNYQNGRVSATTLLGKTNSEYAAENLIPLLKDKDARVAKASERALIELGEVAIKPVFLHLAVKRDSMFATNRSGSEKAREIFQKIAPKNKDIVLRTLANNPDLQSVLFEHALRVRGMPEFCVDKIMSLEKAAQTQQNEEFDVAVSLVRSMGETGLAIIRRKPGSANSPKLMSIVRQNEKKSPDDLLR